MGAGEGRNLWAEPSIRAAIGNQTAALSFEGACLVDTEERYRHCEAAVAAAHRHHFAILTGPGKFEIERPCVLVGSGLSAVKLLPEIRRRYKAGEEIVAIKGAHDWLLRNGIIPVAAIAMDAQQARAKCFRKPRQGVLYLCSSQMHPDTWEHLKDHKVLVWHPRISIDQETRKGWENVYIVPTASTSGLSAILMLRVMGRKVFELYGFDSSVPPLPHGRWGRLTTRWRGRALKLDGARVPTGRKIVEVVVDGQRFDTTAELVYQAQEIMPVLRFCADEGVITVNAHGHGYFQAILAQGKAQGWPV